MRAAGEYDGGAEEGVGGAVTTETRRRSMGEVQTEDEEARM